MEQREEDYIAGVLMIVLGLIGFVASAQIVRVLRRSIRSSSFSSFSLLCCSRALSNCGTLSCFIIYSGPVTLLGYPIGPKIVGLKFGHFTTLTYKSLVYVQLAIAFNRFIATFFSMRYTQICSRRGTFILLGLVWFMTALHCIPEFFGPVLFYPSYTVFIGSIVLNLIIFSKLTWNTIMHMKDMGGQARFRHRKNMKVFVQSFLQELVYIFELFFLQLMKPKERFMEFLCFSLLWEFTHVWDGCIVILYRADMRPNIHLCGKKQTRSRDIMVSRVFTTSKSLDHIDSH
ncbi:hypothetical protein PRIPAC_79023 [Pristionchus pacificus]|uniref:G protein-coupled receptor n=1 Tax=Pristionchus pacificus TaxID=54126 RepID=A0A2A6BDZ6_PRIPA|nr:hypothetical protein PRIPAC_79023 [Pristionchus pacificus]|eukprot:PDM64088.1 G protein-coupled receptor [Pristionchus pacificus]